MPHPPISLLLFYSGANADPVEQRGSLKKSLSETMTRFYPLAGKIKDNLTIECDDYGAYYLETRVKCHLSEVLTHPEANTLKKFLPSYDLHFRSGSSSGTTTTSNELDLKDLIQLVIQNFSPRSSTTADDQEMVTPYFYSASLFPPKKMLASCPFKKLSAGNKHVTRRFVFDASRIAALKAKATNPIYVNNPTRVESVTALIWKCASRVGIKKSSESATRQSVAFVPVNLRGRRIPPMPEHLIGNLVQLAVASKTTTAGASAKEEDVSYLVQLVRDGISKINNDRVKEMQAYSDGGFGEFFREVYGRYRKGEVDLNTIISWCRFPFYEADFVGGNHIGGEISHKAKKPNNNHATIRKSVKEKLRDEDNMKTNFIREARRTK
ncbi:vinorine synthase-like [Papaver somniferum]|uniref:vinorine synthase-like n=1 Tax=Papaver somniferum TaxID=3469 RepID=UPI000E703B0C|nr:vinorine synthase-like [Papaver somniferum]